MQGLSGEASGFQANMPANVKQEDDKPCQANTTGRKTAGLCLSLSRCNHRQFCFKDSTFMCEVKAACGSAFGFSKAQRISQLLFKN